MFGCGRKAARDTIKINDQGRFEIGVSFVENGSVLHNGAIAQNRMWRSSLRHSAFA
jgi:hypothetical protein